MNASLAIDVDCVESVLLADGWHDVGGRSFSLGTYEFGSFSSGSFKCGAGAGSGFTFLETLNGRETGRAIVGPLTAIQAVKEHL